MIAAINAAATNSAPATLVLSLVGLWVITQCGFGATCLACLAPFVQADRVACVS
jgi:hypothetical protein